MATSVVVLELDAVKSVVERRMEAKTSVNLETSFYSPHDQPRQMGRPLSHSISPVRAETEAMMKSKVAKPLFDRQSHELEETHEELSKAEAELHRLREELTHSRTQKEKIHSQLEQLKSESGEEITRLKREANCREEEVRTLTLTLRAEIVKAHVEEEERQKTQHLEELQRKHQAELLQLNSSHAAELDAARTTHGELQDRLRSATSEVLQLRSSVMQFISLEQQLQQEQHRAAVLQHTVDDRIAELDL